MNAIGGYRVGSTTRAAQRPLHSAVVISEENARIAEAIPFWPDTVGIYLLAKRFNLTKKQMLSRMQVFQDAYLVFQEDERCSRLRDDLSNLGAV